ncbi:hypothetical protein [Corticimicrobacter populi]|nr:hypothetical protein [Corticimicrobacter populi]
MNRQQRRAAERQQARQRAQRRVERPIPVPMIVKMTTVLAPLESILKQLELDGTVHVDDQGSPIFKVAHENRWFAMVPALLGVVDMFEMWATRHSKQFDVSALSRLAHKLEYGMPVMKADTDAVRALLPRMQRVACYLSHDEAKNLILQTQIKEEMEAVRS